MDKIPPGDAESDLRDLRAQIDDLDDKLIRLLLERTQVVSRVGELKRREHPEQCPIRPGREAEMVRRIVKKFSGTAVSPAAAAAIWRLLIGMSTSVEGALKFSVYAPEREDGTYWLGREYFGSFIPAIRQPHVKRVIGDVMGDKASVGIVPMLRSDDTSYWWTNLLGRDSDLPKIFAHIPFVLPPKPDRQMPTALAIARIAPEPSGDDISLIVLEADHNVSQHRLQTAFAQVKLQPSWINIATLNPSTRHHLVEVKGFITPDHAEMKSMLAGLSSSILSTSFLGAYAVPVTLPSPGAAKEPAVHVAKPSKT